jgi:hypothetical protein
MDAPKQDDAATMRAFKLQWAKKIAKAMDSSPSPYAR